MEAGGDVNEIEGAGNTPLHCAAYEGWLEGCELLLSLGAKVNASNNAGDRPLHWARNMGHDELVQFLEKARRPDARARPAARACPSHISSRAARACPSHISSRAARACPSHISSRAAHAARLPPSLPHRTAR